MRDQCRLGDGCSITHGYAFSGMVESEDESLPIVVSIGNFKYDGGFRFESTKVQRYTGEYPDRFRLAPGDVLIVMTCQTAGGEILGIPGRIPDDGRSYLHNQRLGRVVITRPEDLDLGYLYYLFLSPKFNAHLVATASGAKILHTAPSRIESFTWHRPPLADQKRIAAILSPYDDLIENNTKRIKLLEEMARSLYREWFVNFRFPGHEKVELVDSPIGKVPEGWKLGVLEEMVSLQRGFDITKAQQREGPYAVISSSGAASTHDEYKVEGPGVVIGRKGTLGTVFFSEGPYWPHDTTLWVTSFHGHGPWFCFRTLQRLQLEQYDCGASNPTINRNHIHKISVAIPPAWLTQRYDEIVGAPMALARVLRDRSKNLRLTRDLLLPRLISGEINVSRLEAPRG